MHEHLDDNHVPFTWIYKVECLYYLQQYGWVGGEVRSEGFCAGNAQQFFGKIDNFELLFHQIRPWKTAEIN